MAIGNKNTQEANDKAFVKELCHTWLAVAILAFLQCAVDIALTPADI